MIYDLAFHAQQKLMSLRRCDFQFIFDAKIRMLSLTLEITLDYKNRQLKGYFEENSEPV